MYRIKKSERNKERINIKVGQLKNTEKVKKIKK